MIVRSDKAICKLLYTMNYDDMRRFEAMFPNRSSYTKGKLSHMIVYIRSFSWPRISSLFSSETFVHHSIK